LDAGVDAGVRIVILGDMPEARKITVEVPEDLLARARLADSLIAQSCIDHGVRLVTRNDDFRHFSRHGGLRLAL
jgi:predicted nucleic acid-binding protein